MPVGIPFILQLYTGAVPAFNTVVVKVTSSSLQTVVAGVLIETSAATLVFTAIVMGLENAREEVTQVSFELTLQVMTSPSESV